MDKYLVSSSMTLKINHIVSMKLQEHVPDRIAKVESLLLLRHWQLGTFKWRTSIDT